MTAGPVIGESNRCKVLLTLLHVHERDGRATMRVVASGAALSLKTTYQHLCSLRDEGLVAWELGDQGGTLRPLVEVVR